MWCCCKYHILYHLFFCFSLNPPMFQSPLGAVGARTGCAFPSVIGSHLDWVLDAELMRKLRGRRRRFPAAPPWTLCCWGSRAALAPLFLLFLLVTPVHLFCCIQSFPLTPRRSIAPSSQHWKFNDYLPQPQMFFNVTKFRISSLRMIFILWFHIYATNSSFTSLPFPLSSYTHGFLSDLLFSLSFLGMPNKNILMMMLFYCKLWTESLNSTRKPRSKNLAVPCIRNTFVQMWISICNYILCQLKV